MPALLQTQNKFLFSLVYSLSLLYLTLLQVKERTKNDPTQLEHLVKKLLIVINRMARLLEIMVRSMLNSTHTYLHYLNMRGTLYMSVHKFHDHCFLIPRTLTPITSAQL